ncbi:MAG: site-2 protease family protein, partial [Acidobacteriota bacterium]|nr:site-2 protease family protein [Acidobacteriota bacterium]
MNYLIGVLLTIIALMISVAFHELGHIIPAKKFGVYVPQYMIGFGPTIYSKQVGETEYGVKAILLGGYVRLAGMFGPAR